MASKKHKAKKSSITKTPPQPPPPPLRLPYIQNQWLWSWTELPPTNPSYHITAARKLWLNTIFTSASAVTKSQLPTTTTTRCDAHHNQPPQLRHIATAPTQIPPPTRPRYHYLHDSTTIAEAASKMPDASHWRVLRYTPTTARIIIPTPKPQSDPLDPVQLLHSCALGPTWPSSGVKVMYTRSRARSSGVLLKTGVSVRYECNAPDPFDTKKKKSMEFTSVVKFQGRYYAMSVQGALAMMQVVDTRLTITAVTATRAVPRSSWRFFKEYLFEMNGEIMLAFLIHRESLAVVDHVEVLKLSSTRFDWVRVEMLRGKTVFLNRRCLWVDSEEFGCGDNRVYFTEGSEERWKVFNMKTCCISPVSSGWSWQSRC